MLKDNAKKRFIMENTFIAVCVVLIWSLGCAYRSIYPFGDKLMDVWDMQAQIVPVYTFLWDVLHGNKSIFFDWSTGLGNNMAGAAWHFTLFSPFNIFFFFIKRSQIERQLFLFLLIKLIAIGMSFRFVLRKWFPDLSTAIVSAFSLLYVFSPFSMEYYRFPAWMDLVFLFPLVMYFYFELMHHRKTAGFTVCLTTEAFMNFQHTFLLVIFLVLVTGGLLIFDNAKYKKALCSLAKTVIIAVCLSACVWLPGILQIMTGKRFDGGINLVDIWNSIWIFHPSKWLKCFNLGVPLGMYALAAVRCRQDKKTKLWYGYLILLLGLPILLESSNMLWHGGVYQGYTMRFSYMLTFWCIMAGSWGCQTLHADKEEMSVDKAQMPARSGFRAVGRNALPVIFSCVLLAVLMVLSVNIAVETNSLIKTAAVILVSFFFGILILSRKRMENTGVFLVSVILSLTLTASNMMSEFSVENSSIGAYNQIWESGYQTGVLSRMKAASGVWTSNYAMVLGCNSISNYMAAEGEDQIESFIRLGYAEIGIRMSDYGGTLFSDALFGVNQLIADEDMTRYSDLYQQTDSYQQGYGIYESKYTYPLGILSDGQISLEYTDDPFENQNAIAEALCGRKLLQTYRTDTEELLIPVESKSVLYVYVPTESSVEGITVTYVENDVEKQWEKGVGGWNNGIINLGTYDTGDVRVSIRGAGQGETVRAALLSLEEFESSQPQFAENVTYTAGKHSLSVYAECQDADKSLFLPVYCDQGWTCRVNGKKVAPEDAISGGMLIPLEQGDNEIELVYISPGLYAGLGISLFGVLLLALFLAAKALNLLPESPDVPAERVNFLLKYMVYLVYGGTVLILYLIPMVFFVKDVVVR